MHSIRLLVKLAGIAATSPSTRVFYDRVAPFYDFLFTGHLPHIRAMAALISEEFPGDDRINILDIACGTGALSRQLEDQGFCVTGLDFSFQSLCQLKQAARTIQLIQADAAAIPFGAGCFDVVTCMGAWRHFPESQRVLNEIRRVLRPDGVFLVGYFPPKLGGLFSLPSGPLGNALRLFYGAVVQRLRYDDKIDEEAERQTLRRIKLAFATYRIIQSNNREYLIWAKSPR